MILLLVHVCHWFGCGWCGPRRGRCQNAADTQGRNWLIRIAKSQTCKVSTLRRCVLGVVGGKRRGAPDTRRPWRAQRTGGHAAGLAGGQEPPVNAGPAWLGSPGSLDRDLKGVTHPKAIASSSAAPAVSCKRGLKRAVGGGGRGACVLSWLDYLPFPSLASVRGFVGS